MGFTATWTNYAPTLTIVIVIILCFIAAQRAVSVGGWYSKANRPTFGPANWLLYFLWFAILVAFTVAWTLPNYRVVAGLPLINSMFGIMAMLILVWFLAFYGGGHTGFGLLVLVALLACVGYTAYLVRRERTSMVILLVFFLWLLYVAYINIHVLRYNTIYRDSREVEPGCDKAILAGPDCYPVYVGTGKPAVVASCVQPPVERSWHIPVELAEPTQQILTEIYQPVPCVSVPAQPPVRSNLLYVDGEARVYRPRESCQLSSDEIYTPVCGL